MRRSGSFRRGRSGSGALRDRRPHAVEVDGAAPSLVGDFLGDDAARVDLAAAVAVVMEAAEAEAQRRLGAARYASPAAHEPAALHGSLRTAVSATSTR